MILHEYVSLIYFCMQTHLWSQRKYPLLHVLVREKHILLTSESQRKSRNLFSQRCSEPCSKHFSAFLAEKGRSTAEWFLLQMETWGLMAKSLWVSAGPLTIGSPLTITIGISCLRKKSASKIQVMSCELRFQIYKLRVQIYELRV